MRLSLIILLGVVFLGKATAQEDKYKALFLYKFMQNFEFPSMKIGDEYRIEVVGNSSVFDQLVSITEGKEVFGKPISVTKHTPGSSMRDVCVLFLSNKDKDLFESLHSEAIKNSTILIGETPGLGEKGAALNFTVKQGKIGFEMNTKTMDALNVKVSSSLKSLAILVD